MFRRKLDRPRWSLSYVAKYRPEDNPNKLVVRLQRHEIGQGWFVLEERREVHGTFYAQDKRLSSKKKLEQLRRELMKSNPFVSMNLGRVRVG